MSHSVKFQTALNLSTGLITVAVQFAVGFYLSPFIVEHLGAEANGFTQLANNFVMYASLLTLAFNSMAGRFVSVAYHRGEVEKANSYYSSVWVANILSCLLLTPIALYIVLNITDVVVIHDVDVLDVRLLFGCVFFNFFLNLASSLYTISLYVKNLIYYSNVINAVRTLLNATLLLVVFSVLPVRMFYVSLVAMVLTLLTLPAYIRLKNKYSPEIRFSISRFSMHYLKEMFSSGIWNTVNQCGHLLNTGLDILLANWFTGPFYMGVLAVSKTMPSAIIQLAGTINTSFSPSVTELWAKQNRKEMMSHLRHAMKISSLLLSIPLITFCCFSYRFYALWQPTLDTGLLTILSFLACLAFIPVAGTQTLYNVFTAANKLKVNSITFVISGILNILAVLGAITFMPDKAIYVIAGSSSVIAILRNICIILPYIAHLLHLKWYEFYKDVAVTLMSCVVNVAMSLAVTSLWEAKGWATLITSMAMVGALTLLTDCFLILSKHERHALVAMIKSKFL